MKTASNMQRVYGCVKILSAFPPKFQLWDNGLVAFLLGRLQTDNPLYVPAEQYTGRAYTLGEHESQYPPEHYKSKREISHHNQERDFY